ncbi:MAG: bifunctional (p)ppGpp synthetase/guanosine-3',5'-bis(diphosphate) 3'-pyrophosphohydrolase [Candidatus Kerfeldbacteria bacterium]|nr:bifunctional (p)ppGpp synthetase/guanosine-3',5'-bis(diphosphate) 3'-pyrophosphohydrolase [Candidatus Kerfeldbacteria bacterium]
MTIGALLKTVRQYRPKADLTLIERAFAFADEAHAGQRRLSGEPYITHPLAAAATLAEFRMPEPVIAAALLHDVPEDTDRTLTDIEKTFGSDIAMLVGGVTKLGRVKYRGVDRSLEALRQVFVAMARDIRVILIKFADRLHNLETLDALPAAKQHRIALETLEIYAPIAQRLGIGDLKGRLEDEAFRFAFPKEYERVTTLMRDYRPQKEQQIATFRRAVQQELKHSPHLRIRFIDGRTKRLYSLYRKLQTHERDITRIYDLVALRIVVDRVQDCYGVLGALHAKWKPLKGRIKDYIAQPKPNGYRSLHTTVFTEQAGIVEIQIRTHDMHVEAEYGAAAHWQYKEHVDPRTVAKHYQWINDIVARQKEFSSTAAYLESLKVDVFRNHIFVFTPKGDVIELPEDATPVDFAYRIHSELGHRCTGAKVNEKMERLDTRLKSGDMVEIIAQRGKKKPSRDWLRFVKTATARSHIRHALR